MSGEPIESPIAQFDREIRRYKESVDNHPLLDPDFSIQLTAVRRATLLAALRDYYPAGHWASQEASYPFGADIELQYMLTTLSRHVPQHAGRTFAEYCARTIRSPALSPFFIRQQHFVVIPAGFLNSVFAFTRNVYALASMGAAKLDPDKRTEVWHPALILGGQSVVCETAAPTYSTGVSHAMFPTMLTITLAGSGDPVVSNQLKPYAQSESITQLYTEGTGKKWFPGYREVLQNHSELLERADTVASHLIAYTLCHELGHGLLFEVADGLRDHPESKDAEALARDEPFADMLGSKILWQLMENDGLYRHSPSDSPVDDFCCAIAGFHGWSLAHQISGVVTTGLSSRPSAAWLARFGEARIRFHEAKQLISQAADLRTSDRWFHSWCMPAAELLRLHVKSRGIAVSIDDCIEFFDGLGDRESEIRAIIGMAPVQSS